MTKTSTLILKNYFHNTETRLRVFIEKENTIILSLRQVKYARNKLCGSKTCQCSGVTGARANWHNLNGKDVILKILPINGTNNKLIGAEIKIIK